MMSAEPYVPKPLETSERQGLSLLSIDMLIKQVHDSIICIAKERGPVIDGVGRSLETAAKNNNVGSRLSLSDIDKHSLDLNSALAYREALQSWITKWLSPFIEEKQRRMQEMTDLLDKLRVERQNKLAEAIEVEAKEHWDGVLDKKRKLRDGEEKKDV